MAIFAENTPVHSQGLLYSRYVQAANHGESSQLAERKFQLLFLPHLLFTSNRGTVTRQ